MVLHVGEAGVYNPDLNSRDFAVPAGEDSITPPLAAQLDLSAFACIARNPGGSVDVSEGAEQDQPLALTRKVTRRTLLRGGIALAAGLPLAGLLAGCSGDDNDADDGVETSATPAVLPSATSAPVISAATSTTAPAATSVFTGEWTFTDDLGKTVTLPSRPERIVAYISAASALWDFGVRPVGIFGTTVRADGTPEITVGNVDLGAVEALGEVYGELDIERLVALQPDLIVSDLWTDTLDLWGLDASATAQVEAVAPIIAIRYIDLPVNELIARFGELAAALGADIEAPAVLAARDAFEQASADFEAATAAKPNMTALFIAGWPENLYIANPTSWADLIYFAQLGLKIVQPDSLDEGYPIWQTLSWEQANKYPADLVLQDARAGAPTIEELNQFPTWAVHPAVQAGQVGPWKTEYVTSYQGFSAILNDLAALISRSRDDVV